MVSNLHQNINEIPTQRVLEMRQTGLTDNQIIQALQHDGYNSQQTLEALEMADMNNIGIRFPEAPAREMSQNPSNIAQPPFMQQMNNSFSPPPMMQSSAPQANDQDMEELIEAIIDEKWAEVEKDINRVLEWKDSVDEKIGGLTAQVTDLKKSFDDLQKAILGKVGDYDKNILNVGIQLKAMEEVFSKVLPTFTDNVSELTRIADKLKKI